MPHCASFTKRSTDSAKLAPGMSVYEAGVASGKGDTLRSSMRKATRTVEKVVGVVGASDLLSGEGEAAIETDGPHTWPKMKQGSVVEEEEEQTEYVTAAVFEDVTLQSGGMDGLVTKQADRKGYMFKKGKGKFDEFKKRWFELYGGQLSYFDENGGRFKGAIDIASDDCKQVRVSEAAGASQFEIEIVFSTRVYRLETQNTDERRGWIAALQDARHGETAGKLRKSMVGEDPPECAMQKGSLSDASFFGEGTGAAAKIQAKEQARDAQKKRKSAASDRWTRPDHDGWLAKLGEKRKTWKKRWFELRGQVLTYYVAPAGDERGHLDLLHPAVKQIRISESTDSERFELEIVCTGRTYRLACAVAEDRREWMEELHRARSGLEKVRSTRYVGLAHGEDFIDGGSGLFEQAYEDGPEEDLAPSDDPDHCSWMAKKGVRRGFSGSAWKKRWFELRGPMLEYFFDEGDEKRGEILLSSAECEAIRVSQSKDAMANELEIVTEERIYRLVCDTREARREWIEELQRARAGVRKDKPETDQHPRAEPGTYAPAFAESHRFSMDEDSGEETARSHAAVSGANDAGIGGIDWAAAFEDSESDEEESVAARVSEGVPPTASSGSIYGAAPSTSGSLYGDLFGSADEPKSPAPPAAGARPSLYGELFGPGHAPAPAPLGSSEHVVEVELREDPQDGELYTKEEFVDQYGGTVEWDQATVHRFKTTAVPAASMYDSSPARAIAPKAEVELREDPEDGELYTKEEFFEQYGGTDEWDRATVHRFNAVAAAAATAPSDPVAASIYDTGSDAPAWTSGSAGSLYGDLFDTPPPTAAAVTGISQLSPDAEAAKAGAAAEAARIASLDSGSSSENEDEDDEEGGAPLELPVMASRQRSSTVPSHQESEGVGVLGLPPVATRGRSSTSPSRPPTMDKAGSLSSRGSGKARRLSLAPTPLLDTLVQLANNDINPNNFNLNDPNALALAAVAAVDAEKEEEPAGEAPSICSSVVDSDGGGGMSSFSELVRAACSTRW